MYHYLLFSISFSLSKTRHQLLKRQYIALFFLSEKGKRMREDVEGQQCSMKIYQRKTITISCLQHHPKGDYERLDNSNILSRSATHIMGLSLWHVQIWKRHEYEDSLVDHENRFYYCSMELREWRKRKKGMVLDLCAKFDLLDNDVLS